jgi:hypothetical protein
VHVANAGDAVGQIERRKRRVGRVDVHVPQAGNEVLPLAVHDPGPIRHSDLAGLADGGDPVAGDDDRHVRPGRRPGGVNDGNAADGHRLRLRVFGPSRDHPGRDHHGQPRQRHEQLPPPHSEALNSSLAPSPPPSTPAHAAPARSGGQGVCVRHLPGIGVVQLFFGPRRQFEPFWMPENGFRGDPRHLDEVSTAVSLCEPNMGVLSI